MLQRYKLVVSSQLSVVSCQWPVRRGGSVASGKLKAPTEAAVYPVMSYESAAADGL